MTVSDSEVIWPDVQCIECGRSLPAGEFVCASCSPPPTYPEELLTEPYRLLSRAKGQLLVGCLFLPWVFGPLALQNTLRARRLAAEMPERNVKLQGQIGRAKLASSVLSVLAYIVLIAVLAR